MGKTFTENWDSKRQKMKIKIVWMSWKLGGFTKFFFKQMLKVSALYLEKQESFIPKKNIFKLLSISKQKSFVYWLNFQGQFWDLLLRFFLISGQYVTNYATVSPIVSETWKPNIAILVNFPVRRKRLQKTAKELLGLGLILIIHNLYIGRYLKKICHSGIHRWLIGQY